ncbi:MAG: hypothetical protein J6Q94_03605 [Clostridia bacterium]|nr:hypothetical protein [Clostridia bacterium]
MAQNRNNVYNFSMFDSLDYGTSAPKLEPVYEPETAPKKKQAVKKKKASVSVNAQKKEALASYISGAKILLSVFSIAFVLGIVLFLNVKMDETATKINAVQSEINIAKSENVRLESTLEGMVSIDKVEDYAEQTLGMVKLENYKITYFDSGESNHVVISGGKSYNTNPLATKFENVKEYFS